MEDLPEALLAEVVLKITRTSDLNSLSLVSKQLYIIDAYQRSAIPSVAALSLLEKPWNHFAPGSSINLSKVEIDYSGWMSSHGYQLDNKDLLVISSRCPSLTDLSLRFCSDINDSGLGYLAYCKKLVCLGLNSVPEITSSGLLSVAVGCKSLSGLFLINCLKIESAEWLEYLGWNGILEELVVKKCKGICQYDLLKFGPGWMKLRKFDFEIKGGFFGGYSSDEGRYDPLYNAHNPSMYDFCCESLKDLRLAGVIAEKEVGPRFVLGKCKALKRLSLEYVHGLNDNDIIVLSKSCLWLKHVHYHYDFRTSFTGNSLKAGYSME